MLDITIPEGELFNDDTQRFIYTNEQTIRLEHSLVSLSKWESIWCRPFLTKGEKSIEESVSYVRCMTLTQNINPLVYNFITDEIMQKVIAYIDAPMTATKFSKEDKQVTNREIITAEVIYYWMIAFNIPFECEKWHLNRLLTLVNVCNIMNQPKKKMSQAELLRRNKALNDARRKAYNTTG